MKRFSKNRRKFKALKKARDRQNVDRINAEFSQYFLDIGSLQKSLSDLIKSPENVQNFLSRFYTSPADVAAINTYESLPRFIECNKIEPETIADPFVPSKWAELEHHMLIVSEAHSPLFYFSGYKKSIKILNQRLRVLRQELRRNFSENLLSEINVLVAEIRQLASEAHEDYKIRSRQYHGKLFSIQRDLRYTYRQIIRFLFKNLDDETAIVNSLFVRFQNKRLLTTEKNHYEFKEEEMDRFHKRSA